MSEQSAFVVPSDIPWPSFVGEPLEELLYWLLDALGAGDLQWRAGSATGTSPDRGRDLEATFQIPLPDGDVRSERWWVQAKGRTSTVAPQVVKDAAVDALGHQDLDVLVIATNSRFSNNTRDWIADFQAQHGRPALRLWDRDTLERLLVKHPAVVARVAPQALSLTGQLEVSRALFWDRQQLVPRAALDRFWQQRAELSFDEQATLALIVSEAATDSLVLHPWGAELDDELVFSTLANALVNLGQLLLRMDRVGVEHRPLLVGVSHLLAANLMRTPPEMIARLLSDPWRLIAGASQLDDQTRTELRELLFGPVVGHMLSHFGTACATDCVRMLGEFEPEPRVRPEHRFLELVPTGGAPRKELLPDPRMLLIETQDAPCRAGLSLDADHGCPFGATDRPWEELFAELRAVLEVRVAQASEQ